MANPKTLRNPRLSGVSASFPVHRPPRAGPQPRPRGLALVASTPATGLSTRCFQISDVFKLVAIVQNWIDFKYIYDFSWESRDPAIVSPFPHGGGQLTRRLDLSLRGPPSPAAFESLFIAGAWWGELRLRLVSEFSVSFLEKVDMGPASPEDPGARVLAPGGRNPLIQRHQPPAHVSTFVPPPQSSCDHSLAGWENLTR